MPILAFLITISLMFYLFYKTKYFRTKRAIEKQWIAGKANISLGLFVSLFGFNQFFLHDSIISRTIGTIFLLYGSFVTYHGIRQYKHFFLQEERQTQK